MKILQLDPPLPVYIVSKQTKGIAIFVRDYGMFDDDYWTCVTPKGELWTVNNRDIRLQNNWTLGIKNEI